jgi:hypothetical protein
MFRVGKAVVGTQEMSDDKSETKPMPEPVTKPESDLYVSINSQQPTASAPSAPPPPKPKR